MSSAGIYPYSGQFAQIYVFWDAFPVGFKINVQCVQVLGHYARYTEPTFDAADSQRPYPYVFFGGMYDAV